MVDETAVMTVPEAAKVLKLSKDTLYDYVNQGLIPHHRLGGRIIISREAFYAWLNGATSSKEDD